MRREFIQLAWQSLRRQQLRSWLTLLGIVIGIAAVVALISLGQGLEQAVLGEVEALGGDTLIVQASSQLGSAGAGSSRTPLTERDVEFLERQSSVQSVSYFTFSSARVEYRDTVRFLTVISVPSRNQDSFNSFFEYWPSGVQLGRELSSSDRVGIALGSQHLTRNLWNGRNIGLNDKLTINDNVVRVVGFYEPTGNPQDDRSLLVTENAFRQFVEDTDRVDTIIVRVTDESRIDEISRQLERGLARERGVDVNRADFSIQTPLELVASFQSIINIVQAVLIGIAGISLFVGGVGITNTMYTSVLERRKEIGIMKAIGAKNSDIFSLFFIESGLLGLVGGIIGIALGVGFALLVQTISTAALGTSFLEAYLTWQLLVGAMLFSFLIGALAGTLPALQAAKEQAADTLHDE